MAEVTYVRPSPIAGTWYEGNPNALAQAVDRYLDQAQLPDISGQVIAVVAPHAGHIYSGPVAGYAFASVRGKTFDVVAVLSPMHQPYYEPLLTTAHGAYGTPLGEVPVDRESLQKIDGILRENSNQGLSATAFDGEHSLEIELPFLQRALHGEFKLVPIMVRSQSAHTLQVLGEALSETLHDRNALVVASTDLSHFYPQNEALAFDSEMLKRIESFSPEKMLCAEEEQKGFACGLGALAAALWAAKGMGADSVKILHHATSGDVTGDYSSVVGYGAAVVLKTKKTT